MFAATVTAAVKNHPLRVWSLVLLVSCIAPPLRSSAFADEHSPRSAGGEHDLFSEGDYWWPDPKDPSAPYVQRDGMTNPDNFVAHRHAMIAFSRHVGAFVSAWRITGEVKYADAAIKHLRAWSIDDATR